MTLDEPKECLIPNKLLGAFYAVGTSLIFVLGLAGLFSGNINRGVIILALLYALLGGLVLFKSVSLVRCPTKIVLGGVLYVSVMALLNVWMF
jgi:hypothetical protein